VFEFNISSPVLPLNPLRRLDCKFVYGNIFLLQQSLKELQWFISKPVLFLILSNNNLPDFILLASLIYTRSFSLIHSFVFWKVSVSLAAPMQRKRILEFSLEIFKVIENSYLGFSTFNCIYTIISSRKLLFYLGVLESLVCGQQFLNPSKVLYKKNMLWIP